MLLDRRSTTRPLPRIDDEQLSLVVSWLRVEFRNRVDSGTIDRIAREEFESFDRARVRDFVPTITWRLARRRLEDAILDQARLRLGR